MTAVLLAAGCLVVGARAGLWQVPVSNRVVSAAMWLLTAGLAVAAVADFAAATNWERFVIAPFVLVLALLALTMADSGRGRRRIYPPHHGHRPTWRDVEAGAAVLDGAEQGGDPNVASDQA